MSMKTIIFISVLMLAFACQHDEINIKSRPNFPAMVNDLKATYASAFRDALKSNDAYSGSFEYLKRNYFTGELKLNSNLIKNDAINARTAASPDLTYLTPEQQVIASP